MKKINKKLIITIFTLVLTSVALVTSIFAWFVSNDTAAASVNGMVIDGVDLIDKNDLKYQYLSYDNDYNYGTSWNELTTITMEKYDMLDAVSSRKEEILFRFKLLDSSKKIKINAITSNISFNFVFDDVAPTYSVLYLSNVIEFWNMEMNPTTKVISKVADSTDSEKIFVDYANSSKKANIEVPYVQIDDYIYFVIDFNEDLVEYIYNNNIGNEILNDRIGFLNDIKFKITEVIE